MGVRQEPSSASRKARSAVVAMACSAMLSGCKQRQGLFVAGAGGDGQRALAGRRRHRLAVDNGGGMVFQAQPRQSRQRQIGGVERAALDLGQPRFDTAAQRSRPSGRGAGAGSGPGGAGWRCPPSRRAATPSATCTRVAMKASRGSSRAGTAASTMPAGMRVGRSFMEWTAASMRPSSRASSSSLVNRPLPPASCKPALDAVAAGHEGFDGKGSMRPRRCAAPACRPPGATAPAPGRAARAQTQLIATPQPAAWTTECFRHCRRSSGRKWCRGHRAG